MEPHLAKLLTNNDPPSETTIHEVKRLLVAPLQELSDTDLEIANLEARLKLLKERRARIQRSMDNYHTILSPIRQLPADILGEIFYHCLPLHRNPLMNASEAPVLLTRVCSTWRSIVLSSPCLWAQIHITFCDNYRHHEPDRIPISLGIENPVEESNHSARVMQILQMRCEIVREWLYRSGTCPLSISIHYTSTIWNRSEFNEAGCLTLELFGTILLFKERWRDLELTMPLETYRVLEDMVSVDTLPILTSLKASFHEQMPSPESEALNPISLLKSPNLKRISLNGPDNLWSPGNILFATWPQSQNLTYICFHRQLNVIEVVSLLKHCQNLVHCKFYIMDFARGVTPSVQDPDDPRLQGLVSLPHLQSLCICDQGQDTPITKRLYDSIDAPSLKWIDYQRFVYDKAELMNPACRPPFLSLLEKSSKLKKLTLDPRGMSRENLRRALQLGSQVTHLVVGQEPVGPFRVLSRDSAPRFAGEVFSPEISDLDLLIIEDDDLRTPHGDIPRNEILLPNLQIVEISLGPSYTISDQKLLKFITGRMETSSPLGIAALKRVRVLFDKLEEIDVVEEVKRYRDLKLSKGAIMSVVNLDLEYLLKAPLEYPETHDSSFGLMEDGRSWYYSDLVESVDHYNDGTDN